MSDEEIYDNWDSWSEDEEEYEKPIVKRSADRPIRQDSNHSVLSCPGTDAPPVPTSPSSVILPQVLPRSAIVIPSKPSVIKPESPTILQVLPSKPSVINPEIPAILQVLPSKPLLPISKTKPSASVNSSKPIVPAKPKLPVFMPHKQASIEKHLSEKKTKPPDYVSGIDHRRTHSDTNVVDGTPGNVKDRAKIFETIRHPMLNSPSAICSPKPLPPSVSSKVYPSAPPLPSKGVKKTSWDGSTNIGSSTPKVIPRVQSSPDTMRRPSPVQDLAHTLAKEAASRSNSIPEGEIKRRSVQKVKPQPRQQVLPFSSDLSPLDKKPWYHGDINREEAENRLRAFQISGTFLLRKHGGPIDRPYVLSLFANGKMYHIQVRRKSNGHFSAGAQDKPDEEEFENVEMLVQYYRDNDLCLLSRGSPTNISCATILTVPARC